MTDEKDRHYSGDGSLWFWNRVKKLRFTPMHGEIYSLGCVLQEVEGRTLWALEAAEREQQPRQRKRGKGPR